MLIDLSDPNVGVVLVPPVELPADVVGYLKKLLVAGAAQQSSLRSAPSSSSSSSSSSTGAARRSTSPFRRRRSEEKKAAGDDQPSSAPAIDPSDASVAAASYTSAGAMDDIERRLGFPLVVQLPSLAESVSTKSGSKRIFDAENVNAFPSIYDLLDPSLLPSAIARLVSRSPQSRRVVAKLNEEVMGRGVAWTSGLAEQLQEKGKIIWMSLMIILELSEEHNPKVKEVKELHEQLVATKENVELTDVGIENDKKKQKCQCGLVGGDSEMQLTVSEAPYAMPSLLSRLFEKCQKKLTAVIKDGNAVMFGQDPSGKGVVVKVRNGAIVLGDTYNGGGGGGGSEGRRSGFSQSSKKNYAGENGGGGGVYAKE
ncbi:uncharacterized protein MONOS_4542 [Monocercomonoides exilis]|uniref:uncharacterized protein n=1 Tax=Monocercomonoides exilis TaxID=2049356 RepID=UPI0035595314|nr:hypothetical protein MONOS_4542 [Monocercomonoides exilis]|eukprot:MONOS_4542.1-p1 / transcript=MONOS_4542.1 / gene=MONOS_4542 / organism=Monocercomonoides_exilis_PA203 / gene_product=unspecified product / transcript_product=unspecified product / location=Mono_scaffold00122:6991-8538(-) / protein_length=369 / sequence_SO=supercontig / SO=protein_coding / is_pseudo=false